MNPVWLNRPEVAAKRARSLNEAGLWRQASTKPAKHPTTLDIAWAAGIYEGEGTISKSKLCSTYGSGLRVNVAQKDSWILFKMRDLFGGNVHMQPGRPCRRWDLHGARALGFIQTIYCLLSPRRQEQARAAIAARS